MQSGTQMDALNAYASSLKSGSFSSGREKETDILVSWTSVQVGGLGKMWPPGDAIHLHLCSELQPWTGEQIGQMATGAVVELFKF